jgi:hypothetical protein
MPIFLSFDVGYKSLAYVLVRINIGDEIINTLDNIEEVETLKPQISNIVQILDHNCTNLVGDRDVKKVPIQERELLARRHLQKIHQEIDQLDERPIVLIEYQMANGQKQEELFYLIMYEFAELLPFKVNPNLKNKVAIIPEGNYSIFMGKYKSLYTANKRHAEFNFTEYLKLLNLDLKISKKELSHISDAFIQILGWLKYGSVTLR